MARGHNCIKRAAALGRLETSSLWGAKERLQKHTTLLTVKMEKGSQGYRPNPILSRRTLSVVT